MTSQNQRTTRADVFFWAAFGLLIFLNWLIFKTMLGPLIFGAILAGSFYPVFEKINSHPKINRTWASLLSSFLILALVVLPLIFLVFQLSKESIKLYTSVAESLSEDAVKTFLFGDGVVATTLKKFFQSIGVEFNLEFIKQKILPSLQGLSTHLFRTLNHWVGDFLGLTFNFLLMLLVTYGLFLDGEKLKGYLFDLSPLPSKDEQLIVDKFNQMNHVTLICNGLGGVLQGGIATIGFYFAGIGSLSLWFTLMTVLAFIPLVGISIVYIPACLYLFLTGKTFVSLVLFTFCTVISLVVENVFKPRFIGQRIEINSLLILFYIIGGMGVFGMAGIFYGPLVGIIFLTAVEIYHDKYSTSGEA